MISYMKIRCGMPSFIGSPCFEIRFFVGGCHFFDWSYGYPTLIRSYLERQTAISDNCRPCLCWSAAYKVPHLLNVRRFEIVDDAVDQVRRNFPPYLRTEILA